MFYRQGSRRSIQRTLGERCEDTRHAAHRLVNQAGSDSYDMTTPGLAHQQHVQMSTGDRTILGRISKRAEQQPRDDLSPAYPTRNQAARLPTNCLMVARTGC